MKYFEISEFTHQHASISIQDQGFYSFPSEVICNLWISICMLLSQKVTSTNSLSHQEVGIRQASICGFTL
jgi:hypothetical protein